MFAQLLLFSPRIRELSNVGRDGYLSRSLLCPVPLLVASSRLATNALAGPDPKAWPNLVGAEHLSTAWKSAFPSPPQGLAADTAALFQRAASQPVSGKALSLSRLLRVVS